jgi:hypothetical protein
VKIILCEKELLLRFEIDQTTRQKSSASNLSAASSNSDRADKDYCRFGHKHGFFSELFVDSVVSSSANNRTGHLKFIEENVRSIRNQRVCDQDAHVSQKNL